jgi:hypothetical protein
MSARRLLPVSVLLCLCQAPVLCLAEETSAISAPLLSVPDDTGGPGAAPSAKAPAPGLDEYEHIPVGLLAAPDTDTKTEAPASVSALPQALGQIPGAYEIPGARTEGEEDAHLPFEEVAALHRQGQYPAVLKNLQNLVAGRNHDAEALYGIMLLNGQGMAADAAKALEYFKRAAEGNKAIAQHYLGNMYFTGQGIEEPDAIHAFMWLNLAVVHYPEGPEKARARKDLDAVSLKMTRLERARALKMTNDWLDARDEPQITDTGQ